MELKFGNTGKNYEKRNLLIAPYGIEIDNPELLEDKE